MANRISDAQIDITEVSFVKRVTIGSTERAMSEEEVEAQMAILNRCLSEPPKGRIIAKKVSTVLFRSGEHEVLLQKITYHVGFKRKPYWLADS